MRTWGLALGCLFVAVNAHGQARITRADADVPVFRAGVDLVALSVVVTDARQRLVTGLEADDFIVFEDGVEQELSFFAAEHVPLDLALLLDTSASMLDKMETMQQAALGFLSTLRAVDRAAIVDIKDTVRILYPLGHDAAAAADAVRKTAARGGTALYNGLYLTLREMVKQQKANGDVRRQAIAVLSDGEDTASLLGYEDVMAEAKRAGITIYTITLKSPRHNAARTDRRRYFSGADFAMRALAQETGARAFFPADIRELAGVYDSIATELANQYALGYTSSNGRRDGEYRRVIVRVEARPGIRTRTRSGYVATRVAAGF